MKDAKNKTSQQDHSSRCSMCGKEIHDTIRDSNNAFPFIGRCCNECDIKKVIPIRYALSKGYALLFIASDDSHGDVDVIIHPERLSLDDLHEKIGGYIEVVNLSHDYIAIVDEDGLLKGLPINKAWKLFEYSKDYPYPFVGNVLFMKKEQLK